MIKQSTIKLDKLVVEIQCTSIIHQYPLHLKTIGQDLINFITIVKI